MKKLFIPIAFLFITGTIGCCNKDDRNLEFCYTCSVNYTYQNNTITPNDHFCYDEQDHCNAAERDERVQACENAGGSWMVQ